VRNLPAILAALLLAVPPALPNPWADEVVSVTFGPGAGFGQGEWFPGNILGPPDPMATPGAPAASEEELLTLGTGGEIILTFHSGGIMNGPGPDFTIFENPFVVGDNIAVFREVALVAVSEDGLSWHTFPYDSETFEGLAGVTPTNGWADPTNPAESGGDSFDLETVGLDQALFLRITDAGDLVPDSGPSFDLDAVAVIHGESNHSSVGNSGQSILPVELTIRCYPNPFNSRVNVQISGEAGEVTLTLFDMLGKQVTSAKVRGGSWSWQAGDTPSGVYLLQVRDRSGSANSTRLTLIR